MIQPHFTYGDTIYAATSEGNLKKLQRVQNRGLKVCLKPEPKISIENLHKQAGINKLSDLREATMLSLAYKRAHQDKHVDQRDIRTRAHDFPVLKIENNIKIKYEKSVQYCLFKTWSETTREIKSIPTYPLLKNQIHLLLKHKLCP